MAKIVLVHGMFQNPKSWERWVEMFQSRGHDVIAPAWPLHEGEPAELRANPPQGLGKLELKDVLDSIRTVVGGEKPILVGHSVGGLVAQLLMQEGLLSAAIAISSVAPNAMLDFDWGFLKNATIITNPLKGDEPILTDPQMFHDSFANTLSEAQARIEFERTATHDSRNVLRGCMGPHGHVDLKKAHGPLLLIGGEKDQIIPNTLVQKNAQAYDDPATYKEFAGRSHYICNEPGWEEVAGFIADWIDRQAGYPAGP